MLWAVGWMVELGMDGGAGDGGAHGWSGCSGGYRRGALGGLGAAPGLAAVSAATALVLLGDDGRGQGVRLVKLGAGPGG